MIFFVLNIGSSSIKYKMIDVDLETTASDGIIDLQTGIWIHQGVAQDLPSQDMNIEDCLKHLFSLITETFDCVVHRVVHGGRDYTAPLIINKETLNKLKKLDDLAPLHNPFNLLGIETAMKYSACPHIAIFDTSFHASIPIRNHQYALPLSYYAQGIQRYGFHGNSHAYVSNVLRQHLNEDYIDCISCHLGNGASICAIKRNKSIATSMGFTPLEGLVMGTRSGDIDPGIIAYLYHHGQGLEDIMYCLNHQSGLLGLTGTSDMREIIKRKDNPDYQNALEIFCTRIAHYIGSYMTEVDLYSPIIFTGGIGEHAALIRSMICKQCAHLGYKINDQAITEKKISEIHNPSSKGNIYVIKTNEELWMAKEAKKIIDKT